MAESVTVTPGGNKLDTDGNPVAGGTPVALPTLAVAPGNTLLTLGVGADLDDVEFTVYMPLGSAVADDDQIAVRGRLYRARVQEWRSPKSSRGGLAVLCRSVTGAS